MSSKARRRPVLRAPFVFTAVAASALAGCGGSTADIGGPGPAQDAGADARTAPDTGVGLCPGPGCNPPPVEQCPAQMPALHTTCGASGLHCPYADPCDPTLKAKITVDCTSGKWEATGLPPIACPAVAPANGASCSTCAGRYPAECAYGDCGGTPTTHAVCEPSTGSWSVSFSSCNPPPPPQDGG